MIERSEYRTTAIPNKPGVYVFRDRFREVIYVGKAKSLRKRLGNYFQPSRKKTADAKLRSLINSIEYFEIIPVRTEEEAMLFESRLIKQYSPRYNVVLRDDKRFLLIKIDIDSQYPRLTLARIRKNDSCLYYGPFPHAGMLRDTVDYLTRHFGLRSCTPKVPGEKDRRHCLDRIVRYCTEPCVQKVDQDEYRSRVNEVIELFNGKIEDVVTVLESKMTATAARQNFESAAKLRDMIDNMRTIFGAQNRSFARTSIARHPGRMAVHQLQRSLNLNHLPNVIECFDISNISGSFAVGSMVCFKEGAPAKTDYRHYKIKTVSGVDDFAMMSEVIERRYQRLIREEKARPDLIVVDGGLGQLHCAMTVLERLNIRGQAVIGLAKRQEEVFMPDLTAPIRLGQQDISLQLLQAIRDEAHRFANTYHRELRRKRIQNSVLDEIPGIGKKRKQELLRVFGSVKAIKKCDASQIAHRLPGIGDRLAKDIVAHVNRRFMKRNSTSFSSKHAT